MRSEPGRPDHDGEERSAAGEVIPIHTGADVSRVRRVATAAMATIGASKIETTRMVTAASELARNTLEHGGGGEMRIAIVGRMSKRKVEMTFIDQGPGIPDIPRALTDGYSTGGGLGLGLSGAKRLCKEFEIKSAPGEGTTVKVASWTERP
jgi:serine/threonine-protein kinase RsbT